MAGMCQVIATTPMEIVKIRMQTMPSEEITKGQMGALKTTVRELGLKGLYQGTCATLARDVPFSAVHFSGYGLLRRKVADAETGKVGSLDALVASCAAGVVAARSVSIGHV